jgi:hypothetical protein
MRTLREDGIRNILDGYTTVEEVLKYKVLIRLAEFMEKARRSRTRSRARWSIRWWCW